MKRIIHSILVFTFTSVSLSIFAQCDGVRFIDDVFTEITVTEGIKFGEGTEINGTFKELFMDIYEPANDQMAKRPTIVLAFGGSFVAGEREDLDFLCNAYARKGYVAVTIDYRLYDGSLFPLPTAAQMQEVVIKSVADMKAAIKYLRQDADTQDLYGIDPNIIFSGGISAGSITAAHTAVLDSTDIFEESIQAIIDEQGGLEGTTNDLDYNSDVQGFVNFSGGLADASWIDADDPSFISIHEEFDGVVPYNEGFANIFGFDIIFMQGSKKLQEVADSVGVVNELNTIVGSANHVGYFSNPITGAEIIGQTAQFLEEIVCSISTSTEEELEMDVVIYPNPTSGQIQLNTSETNYDVVLIDQIGRRLQSWNRVNSIDIRNHVPGFYFLRMTDGNGNMTTQSIVLER